MACDAKESTPGYLAICLIIISGRYTGSTGTVDSGVFQGTVDCPNEDVPGYHVVIDWTVGPDQSDLIIITSGADSFLSKNPRRDGTSPITP